MIVKRLINFVKDIEGASSLISCDQLLCNEIFKYFSQLNLQDSLDNKSILFLIECYKKRWGKIKGSEHDYMCDASSANQNWIQLAKELGILAQKNYLSILLPTVVNEIDFNLINPNSRVAEHPLNRKLEELLKNQTLQNFYLGIDSSGNDALFGKKSLYDRLEREDYLGLFTYRSNRLKKYCLTVPEMARLKLEKGKQLDRIEIWKLLNEKIFPSWSSLKIASLPNILLRYLSRLLWLTQLYQKLENGGKENFAKFTKEFQDFLQFLYNCELEDINYLYSINLLGDYRVIDLFIALSEADDFNQLLNKQVEKLIDVFNSYLFIPLKESTNAGFVFAEMGKEELILTKDEVEQLACVKASAALYLNNPYHHAQRKADYAYWSLLIKIFFPLLRQNNIILIPFRLRIRLFDLVEAYYSLKEEQAEFERFKNFFRDFLQFLYSSTAIDISFLYATIIPEIFFPDCGEGSSLINLLIELHRGKDFIFNHIINRLASFLYRNDPTLRSSRRELEQIYAMLDQKCPNLLETRQSILHKLDGKNSLNFKFHEFFLSLFRKNYNGTTVLTSVVTYVQEKRRELYLLTAKVEDLAALQSGNLGNKTILNRELDIEPFWIILRNEIFPELSANNKFPVHVLFNLLHLVKSYDQINNRDDPNLNFNKFFKADFQVFLNSLYVQDLLDINFVYAALIPLPGRENYRLIDLLIAIHNASTSVLNNEIEALKNFLGSFPIITKFLDYKKANQKTNEKVNNLLGPEKIFALYVSMFAVPIYNTRSGITYWDILHGIFEQDRDLAHALEKITIEQNEAVVIECQEIIEKKTAIEKRSLLSLHFFFRTYNNSYSESDRIERNKWLEHMKKGQLSEIHAYYFAPEVFLLALVNDTYGNEFFKSEMRFFLNELVHSYFYFSAQAHDIPRVIFSVDFPLRVNILFAQFMYKLNNKVDRDYVLAKVTFFSDQLSLAKAQFYTNCLLHINEYLSLSPLSSAFYFSRALIPTIKTGKDLFDNIQSQLNNLQESSKQALNLFSEMTKEIRCLEEESRKALEDFWAAHPSSRSSSPYYDIDYD